ncbi:hypothetical protein BDA96_05G246200 [Sorghum bicolor]|uniref:Uncharacterized protein n=1 Tax=Sorghum bicolor TaxID=4558 RepID=A0A921UHE1_SORBI|nr:hypothetical protein BDA96_05G246200 [Sorghum bicolor]
MRSEQIGKPPAEPRTSSAAAALGSVTMSLGGSFASHLGKSFCCTLGSLAGYSEPWSPSSPLAPSRRVVSHRVCFPCFQGTYLLVCLQRIVAHSQLLP